MQITEMTEADWPVVQSIHREGIATGNATFESEPSESWQDWSSRTQDGGNLVIRTTDGTIAGWASLTPVSSRCVYSGIAEVSIYIAADKRGQGFGSRLLKVLVEKAEKLGLYMLQVGIFPENKSSIKLHQDQGFRIVGTREKLGKMSYGQQAGKWRDVVFMERRSSRIAQD